MHSRPVLLPHLLRMTCDDLRMTCDYLVWRFVLPPWLLSPLQTAACRFPSRTPPPAVLVLSVCAPRSSATSLLKGYS